MSRRIVLVLPTLKPRGGVVKALDLVTHARAAGREAVVFSPDAPSPDLPVFGVDRLGHLLDDGGTTFTTSPDLRLGPQDYGLLSLPSQYRLLTSAMAAGQSPERIIHYVQGTRHANPLWLGGTATRLLTRPFARVHTNDVVAERAARFQHGRSLSWTIPLGHPLGYFARPEPRSTFADPVRVAYTTWKSTVGDDVAAHLEGRGFTFRAAREAVGWAELRRLYHWADVFLGTPSREEGFYMPGLEAMEAGAVLIVPDAGGNMAYSRFDENSLGVGHEQVGDYVDALQRLRGLSSARIDELRRSATRSVKLFDINAERTLFQRFLEVLDRRVEGVESGDMSPYELTPDEGLTANAGSRSTSL